MKEKTLILLLVFSILSININCQDDTKFISRNSFHIELGGSGLYYSLNYERNIINRDILKTSVQIGIRYFPGGFTDITFPFGINEQFSFNMHHIELGFGMVPTRQIFRDPSEQYEIIHSYWINPLTGRLGYRYQKPDGKFIWRIGFTPFLGREGKIFNPQGPYKLFAPWGSISLGYAW